VPLYEKIRGLPPQSRAPAAVVSAASARTLRTGLHLAAGDCSWGSLVQKACDVNASTLQPHIAHAEDVINVLFSSGTTGTPKAIPWTHITALRWEPNQSAVIVARSKLEYMSQG
jgi:acetyl-CoA synthetase